MITETMVKHIKDTLNSLTKGKNPIFGTDENAGETAPAGGILVVLTDGANLENFTSYNQILASSTVLDKNDETFTTEGKTIKVVNIPYSETISVNEGKATGFGKATTRVFIPMVIAYKLSDGTYTTPEPIAMDGASYMVEVL